MLDAVQNNAGSGTILGISNFTNDVIGSVRNIEKVTVTKKPRSSSEPYIIAVHNFAISTFSELYIYTKSVQ